MDAVRFCGVIYIESEQFCGTDKSYSCYAIVEELGTD